MQLLKDRQLSLRKHGSWQQAGQAEGGQGRELDTRALSRVNVANVHEGVRGHVVDQGRDEARGDCSYSRCSANITPATFADQLSRRRFNETTARVEEISREAEVYKFPPATDAPIQVTVQTPAGTAQPAQGTPAASISNIEKENTC